MTVEEVRYTPWAVKYSLIAVYGLWASVSGVLTIERVAGREWSLLWPILVFLVATTALIGLFRYTRGHDPGLEIWATRLLVALFVSYSVFIFIGSIHGPTSGASGMLPIILCVFPLDRLIQLDRRYKGKK